MYVKDDTKTKRLSPKRQVPWKGPLIVSACRGSVLYEIQVLKCNMILHHDRLIPYDSEVVPSWIKRQRSKVLQWCQEPAIGKPEEDVLLVLELPVQKDKDKDPAEEEASPESCDQEKTTQVPRCQQKKRKVKDIQGRPVTTSSGCIVNKPDRFRN